MVRPRSMPEVVLNCVGFLAGLGLMTADCAGWPLPADEAGRAFLWKPKTMIWVFLVAAQFGFWANAIVPLWTAKARLTREYQIRLSGEAIIKRAVALVLFMVPLFIIWRIPDSALPRHGLKVGVLFLAASGVAMVAVAGIWSVRAAIERIEWAEPPGPDKLPRDRRRIEQFLRLRKNLQHFIAFLGVLVGLATLARGALRQAYLADGGSESHFPAEYVLLHGAYFTGLLALVYIPTYNSLVAAGGELLDSVYPIASAEMDFDRLADWQRNRKGLEDLLELKSGAMDNFKASVSILAPLVGGVVSVLPGAH